MKQQHVFGPQTPVLTVAPMLRDDGTFRGYGGLQKVPFFVQHSDFVHRGTADQGVGGGMMRGTLPPNPTNPKSQTQDVPSGAYAVGGPLHPESAAAR